MGSRATSVGRSVARFDHSLGKFFSAGARERSEASIDRSIGRADGSDAGATRRRAADAGDWSSPGLGVIPDRPANYVKSPLGVTYEQINEGVGDPARPGDVAVFHWILRRANGYFIYGSVDCGIGCGNGDPSEYVLGPDGRLIPGLDELLTGMRPGEKRRALVPPELGYVSKGMEPQPPEFGQKRQVEVHAREPLVFEVKLIKVRNKRAA